MNLIQGLQSDILDPKTSLSSILRKAKVLASTLRNEKFEKWVDNELNGYPGDKKEIPDYRQGRTESFGHFTGPFGSGMENAPIPTLNLPEPVKEFASRFFFFQGVRALESLIKKDSSLFCEPWPANAMALMSDRIYEGYVCMSAWKSITRSQVEQVLDTVRNKLLSFVLELQKNHPEVSKSEDAISRVPEGQVASAVNTIILGSQNIVASGFGIEQRVDQQIPENDMDALLRYIKEIGLPADEAKELKKAVEEDGPRPERDKLGSKVAGWLGKMTEKIAEGTLNIPMQVVSALIMQALSSYYGWH